MSADDFGSFGFIIQKFIHLRDGAVKSDHGVTVVVHIQDEVLSHHCQADECDIRLSFHDLKNRRVPYKTNAPAPEDSLTSISGKRAETSLERRFVRDLNPRRVPASTDDSRVATRRRKFRLWSRP